MWLPDRVTGRALLSTGWFFFNEIPVLGMLITTRIRKLGPFWRNDMTAQHSIQQYGYAQIIFRVFRYRIISKGLWPPRSPDFSPSNHFLWVYIKDLNNSRNLDESKTIIITSLPKCHTWRCRKCLRIGFILCAQLCMQHTGAHFENFFYEDVL
jgi:hypothetical protein